MNTNKKEAKVSHPHRSTTTPEFFFHLRGVKIPRSRGRFVSDVTAFARPGHLPGTMVVTFAECDSRDQFNRRAGRTVARRKWFNDSGIRAFMLEEGQTKPTFEQVFKDYIAEDQNAEGEVPLFVG